MTPLQPVPAEGVPPGAPSVRSAFRRTWASIAADRLYLALTALAALASVLVVAYLIVKTVQQTGDTWRQVGVWNFLTGTEWAPGQGKFGALPAIWGTIVVSAIAMVVALPLAIGVALATTVLLPRRLRGPVAAVIDLLAAIPSVVYGLWGFLVLVPTLKPLLDKVAANSHGIGALEGPVLGGSLLLAGLVLAIMILPIITAVIREVLATVPREQREAALALGATRWEMIRGSMLPWARSGIVGASALGLGRAIGETIAVAMILGNSPTLWESLLRPGQTLAGTVALEYNSATSPLHTSSLIAMGVTLFAISFFVNLLARALVARGGRAKKESRLRPVERIGDATRRASGAVVARVRPARVVPGSPWVPRVARTGPPRVSLGRRIRSRIAEILIGLAVVVAMVPLFLLIGYAVAKGAEAISWTFFSNDGEPDIAGNGIQHALVGTLILMFISTAVAVPFGVLTALFLREASTGGRAMRACGRAVGLYVDVLLGVPSIVAGLVIAIAVVRLMGHYSALAGGLALALIMFPIVVRSSDEILRLVPGGQVEAALALGAPRWRSTWSVVLPAALPGILTGVTIALARVSGETAPLLLTSLGAQFYSASLTQPIAALPQYIFTGTINSTVPVAQSNAWGAALVLVALILILNIIARIVSRHARGMEVR